MKTLLALVTSSIVLAAPAAASAPIFTVAASAIVLPAKPSIAKNSVNIRGVYRVARGVYCVSPAPSLDWTSHIPLVAPLPAQSPKGRGTLVASWEAGGQHCPAAAIQVRTYRVIAGAPESMNDVAFHVLIGGNG